MIIPNGSITGSITPELAVYLTGGLPELNPAQLSENVTQLHIIEVGRDIARVLGAPDVEATVTKRPMDSMLHGHEFVSDYYDIGMADDRIVRASLTYTNSHWHTTRPDGSGRLRTERSPWRSVPAVLDISARVDLVEEDPDVEPTSPLFASASTYNGGFRENLPGLDAVRDASGNQLLREENTVLFIRSVAQSVHRHLQAGRLAGRANNPTT